MAHHPFDDLADVYESLVDWPKRLSREATFYRRIFADYDVQRVSDVACGSGHHAAMFHGWDLTVEGSDVSAEMIERARREFGEPEGLCWTVRDFTEPALAVAPTDAVICVGNSLALVADHQMAQNAIQQMLHSARSGGIVILHVFNLWALPDGPCVWQKCVELERIGRRAIVTKGVHRCGELGFVDLVISSVDPAELLTTHSVPLLGLTAEQLVDWAQQAGGTCAHLLGDYQRTTYDPDTSTDLIAILVRE